MTDLTRTIAPKSDQLNADDLIGRTLTIKVTRVSLLTEADQPVAINFEGDNGKPYKPCKSMRRVLVTLWGGDGNAFAGRRMTLFRDDTVMFGGAPVGGIRISHMSDIEGDKRIMLTATRASRKPFLVKPLPAESKASPAAASTRVDAPERPVESRRASILRIANEKAAIGSFALAQWMAKLTRPDDREIVREIEDELTATAEASDLAAERLNEDEMIPA